MTELEAKSKWCPMVRTASIICNEHNEVMDIGSSYNKVSQPEDHIIPPSCHCIASECMMWREQRLKDEAGVPYSIGYCGLAGKPL